MAMATATEFRAAIASWLNRTDLTSTIPDFITLAEAALNARLRVAEMETTADLSPTDGLYTIPADSAGIRAVRALTSPAVQLKQVGNDYADTAYATRGTGHPAVYTINGSTIRLYPATASDIELRYYQKLDPLADNASNWLLTGYPQVYLYATLLQSAPFLGDDARLATWGALLDNEMNALESRDVQLRYGRMISRVRGVTP